MSPEQAAGRRLDFRADLYSLGATLFHLLTGQPPFSAATPLDLIVRHAVEPAPRIGEEFPPAVRALVARLLDKNPARRAESYAQIVGEIGEALESGDAVPAPVAATPPVSDGKADPIAASQLAAARAAIELGRARRAKDILERLVKDQSGVWADASFLLASVHEQAGDLPAAREVLERVAAETRHADVLAFALWSLGKLAEAEAGAAIQSAIAAYQRVMNVSSTAFPKQLVEARIDQLRRQDSRRLS